MFQWVGISLLSSPAYIEIQILITMDIDMGGIPPISQNHTPCL